MIQSIPEIYEQKLVQNNSIISHPHTIIIF